MPDLSLDTPSSTPAASSSSLQTPISPQASSSRPATPPPLNGHQPQDCSMLLGIVVIPQNVSLDPPLPIENFSPGPQRLPRQPSSDFAELHNELEIEQEAAVNRLLNMIRLQQIQNQQSVGTDDGNSSTGATYDSASTTNRARSPGVSSVRRTGLSRQSSFNQHRPASRASSTHTSSPSLQPVGNLGLGGEEGQWLLGGSRDEASFYMAETQMLTRENEMLKKRIRELERQVAELKKFGNTNATEDSPVTSPGDIAAAAEVGAASGDKTTPPATQSSSEGPAA
ncbi:hypothetical protein BDZ91DRAFT_744138 [Kalaharituber pfeilii]|nr:hypothetical protein BDZ91DRAFT_744138 [Kalaharituber pfeilii]